MKLVSAVRRLVRSLLFAAENPLLGTWKLKSYVATTEAGEMSTPYGEHPSGYLSYSADGRMHAIGIADGRLAAAQSTLLTDGDLAALHRTMFAYAGAYSVGIQTLIHHVDVCWNPLWDGTDQIRFFALSGNTLTITSRAIDPVNGMKTTYVVFFERIENLGRRRSGASQLT
jgi:Lipocalin-like domain